MGAGQGHLTEDEFQALKGSFSFDAENIELPLSWCSQRTALNVEKRTFVPAPLVLSPV
jgi:hypothetical protein